MILQFSTKLNGKPTYFMQKIWAGLIDNNISKNFNQFYYQSEEMLKIGHTASLSMRAKIHTIRDDKTNRWQPGTMIDFFINARTKNMFRFAPSILVVSTQDIEIVYYTDREVLIKDLPPKVKLLIDGKRYDKQEDLLCIATNDGFDTVEDFFAYFNTDFTGKIIHWTNFKY